MNMTLDLVSSRWRAILQLINGDQSLAVFVSENLLTQLEEVQRFGTRWLRSHQ